MTEVTHSGRTLRINGTAITVRHPIKTVVDVDSIVIVLLQVPTGEVDNRNVIAFDSDGDQLWEIEPSPHGTEDDNPFVALTTDAGSVVAQTWNGIEYVVDIETGAIEARDLKRF